MTADRAGVIAGMLLSGLLFLTAPLAAQTDRLLLRVHDSGRYLVDGTGQPFFWLGDTAWGLFTGLTEAETADYFEDRAAKGFSVVQAVLVWGAPNADPSGELPWLDGNPATPNSTYFDRVARIVEMAAERGIVMALLPAWGDFVTVNDRINDANAYAYGNWLGLRLGRHANIVWVLGGDRLPDGREPVFRQLAAGIAEAEELPHLMTYHPRGGGHSSAEFFHEDEWLDLNMIQTAHSIGYPEHRRVLTDYALTPVKPTLVGEPRYEHITHGLRNSGPRIDDHEVRKAAWTAVLSGACGHTYGANGIFQFATEGEQTRWQPILGWRTALDFPGARHMGVMRAFLESVDWWRLQPAADMVAANTDDSYRRAAAVTAAGDLAVIYLPAYQPAAVDLPRIAGEGVRAEWLNPRTGAREEIGELDGDVPETFLPPSGDEDPDWVLVLQSARPDTTAPRITSVSAGGDPSRIRVRFSEPLDPGTAQSAPNYVVEPDVTVAGAEMQGDAVVVLSTSPMSEREYTLTVTGVTDRWVTPNAVEPGTSVTFTWTAEPPRVTDGLAALFTFGEATAEGIPDLAEGATPLNLQPGEGDPATVRAGVLNVQGTALAASEGPAADLARACMASNELSIEAWVRPAALDQTGPARVVTLSRDSAERNFTLGQDRDRWIVRVRTTSTGANGTPDFQVPMGSLTTDLTHVLFTRASDGTARIYLNGALVAEGQIAGDLSNWSEEFRFGLANELTRDRAWRGELHLVAVYARALSADEVARNYEAGC